MKTQINTLADEFIPTLVLKNTVLLPGITLPVLVSKAVGLNALHHALTDRDKRIVALTLKEGVEIDSAHPSNFYHTGTLCSIESVETTENDETIAYIVALHRFDIREIKYSNDFASWESCGHVVPDLVDLDGPTEKALMTSLKDISKEILESMKGGANLKRSLDGFSDVGQFTNIVAQNLPLIIPKKQEILEISSIKTRALKVLELLVEQREMIKVNNEMGLKISEKTSKAYREAILREQLKAIKEELGEGYGETEGGEKQSYKERIIAANLPKDVEKVATEQANRYENMGAQNPESNVIRNYLEFILALPWNDKAQEEVDLDKAEKILNDQHYGLEKIKKHIIEHLAVMKLSPNKKGSILLLVGPPGVGKTSLGQSIAKALGREFVRASLGGVRDESEIRGHRRTYIGALPGRILEGIKRAKEKNPVFMLDEIDKLARGYGGDPAAALLEALDPEQNATFTDHYLDLPFDLSKVFFIATANSLETIPAPLLDRMEIIQLTGYTAEEKLHIAKSHLVPKQLKEHGLQNREGVDVKVVVEDNELRSIIADYTKEAGVRDLQRKIAKVFRSLTEKIVRNGHYKEFVVNQSLIEEVLGLDKNTYELAQEKSHPGVVTGLAWTPVGGDILFIETAMMPGTGKIQLTGKLGEVMSESAQIGLSLVRSKLSALIPGLDFTKTDFHIHVPSGAIAKDGPSAGITIFTALCSLVLGKGVDPKLAMTGEVTLRGAIMPVGGIKEKLIAAHRAGINKIIMSRKNEKDLRDVPEEVKKDIKFVFVDNINELLSASFGRFNQNIFCDGLLHPPTAPQSSNFSNGMGFV